MESHYFYRKLVLWILVSISIFKLLYFYLSGFSLFTEETQYWLWSKHLDWNYYSKPMMVAVLNFLSTSVFGNTEFAIKFNAVLLSFGTAWVIFEFSLAMFQQPKVSFYTILVLLVMPFYHLGSFFHTTDSSLYFFWILSFYLLWKAGENDQLKWWILAGLAASLGMLSKNIMILIIPIMGLYLAMTNSKRLLQKGFWIFIIITMLSMIPILYWNIKYNFVNFRHVGTLGGIMGNQTEMDFSQSLRYLVEYIGGQFGMMSPFLIPILFFCFWDYLKERDNKALFLILPVLNVWLFFLLISLNKEVYANWPAFGMLTLPILIGYFLHYRKKWEKYFKIVGIFSGAIMMIILFSEPLDAIGFKKILKPSHDPIKRLIGYREVGARLDFILDSICLEKVFIFSDSYHIASEMAFYLQKNPQTYTVKLGRRKNQFDLWPGIDQFEDKGYDAIYITREPEIQKEVFNSFEEILFEEKYYTIYRSDTVRIFNIAVLNGFRHLEEYNTDNY